MKVMIMSYVMKRFGWTVIGLCLLALSLTVTDGQAGCLKTKRVSANFKQTICPGTENERTVTKTASHTVVYTTPGCEESSSGAPTGGTTSGGTGGGGGGVWGQGGGGGGIGGRSSTLISPETCFSPAGGAGTAGGDNGNPGLPPGLQVNSMGSKTKDTGCGGDAGSTCVKCEPVTQSPGSLTILTNGTYSFDAIDFNIPARGMDVLLRRAYRSNRIMADVAGTVFAEPAVAPFGYGWSTPFTVRIADGNTFVDADGRYFTFQKDDTGNFLTDAASGLTLKKTATGFELKKLDTFTRTFDAEGKLLTKSDNYGNSWTMQYDGEGRLVGVTDAVGRQALTFTWNASERIESATDLAGRTVTYGYDPFGNLVSVTDPAGFESNYAYNTFHGITSKANPLGETYTIEYRYADRGIVGKVTDPIGTALVRQGKPAGDHQVVYQYDFANKVFYVTEKGGRQIKRVVNADGLPTAEVEVATGTVLKKIEYLDNRIEKTTDEAGNVTLKQKDEWGNLLRKVDGEGNEWRYTYTTGNRMASSTDPLGIVTRYAYDGKGKVVRATWAAGTSDEVVTSVAYDEYGQLVTRTVAGATTRYKYDEAGRMVAVIDPLGHTSRMEYDEVGNLVAAVDANGNRTILTYDARGKLLTVKDPLGNVSSLAYDAAGRLSQATDALGRTTKIETDFQGRPTAVVDALNHRRELVYDPAGNLIEISDGDAVSRIEYDERGRLVAVTDPEENTIRYEYAEGGCSSCGGDTSQPKRVVDPFGNAVENLFDKNGRIVGIQDPLSNLTSLAHDPRGQVARRTDGNGNITTYVYDALGRSTRQTDAEGGVTAFSYDQRGNLISLTDPEGNTTTFEYDLAGRKTKEIRPMGTETVYTYYDNGLPKTVKDAKQQLTRYTYDAANRLTEVTYADDSQDTFGYDAVGNLISYANPAVSGSLAYDALNRKLSETVDYGSFQRTYSYSYDARGNKATYTSPEGLEHAYIYRKNDQLASITVDGKTFTFDYDKHRLSKLTFPNGVVSDYAFNPNSWLTGITTTGSGGTTILSRGYTHDSVGNIKTKNTEHGPYKYGYDKTYQLTSADNPTLADEGYSYDQVGNRLTSLRTAGLWSHNANNELISDTAAFYEYDANGNTTKKTEGGQITRYEYNARNRLSKVYLPDGRVAIYTYDPFGRRISKVVANTVTYFAYADEGLIGEYAEEGALLKAYGWRSGGLWGTDPLYQIDGGQMYLYHNDHLATPQRLTDEAGMVVWGAGYRAFGLAVVDPTLTVENNLRFPGQYWDSETGLHFNCHRYYVLEIGRYLRADPIGLAGGINPFVYSENNPVNLIDPLGLDAIYINYDHYPVKTPIGKLPLGHGGVVAVDPKTGTTKYYEFGRYYGNKKGVVRGAPDLKIPNVTIGKNGLPTQKSLNRLYDFLSKQFGKNSEVSATYYADSDFQGTIDYVKEFSKNHPDYHLRNNNCKTFGQAAATACKEEDTCQ
jgi:RHS repeat-associated protein